VSSRSWGHGQTFIGGAIGGLALAQHPVVIFVAGIIVGAALVLLARFGRRAAELVAEWARRRRADALVSGPLPRRGARRRA
jgi:hypothetical protein